MPKLAKRARANAEMIPAEAMSAPEAIAALKKYKAPKFDQTVNVVFHLGIDPAQADQAIRGAVALPKGIGKTKKVVAFCREDVAKEAKAAGATEAGAEDLVAKIEGGWMDFDVAIASPDMMRVVSKLGKVLGPKGLMPSPKAGTVTNNVVDAVREYSAGKVEYRNDKGGNIHGVIGKMSFTPVILVPQSIELSKTAVSVMVNKTSPLAATIKPSTATNKEVTWTSSNPAVATVDAKGNIKGVKVGTATITATAKGATAVKKSIPVTVTKILPTGISLSKSALNIANNQTVKVTASIAPADAAVKTVLWKSSNPKVATVDAQGNIKGLINGSAIITATAKDNAKVIKTVAVKVSTKTVKLNKTSFTLLAGKTETLKATVSPVDSTSKGVAWKSSNTKVATVDAKGKVTAKAKGTANITATVKGAKVASAKITVTAPIAASSVKLSSTSATLAKGKTMTLTGTVSPSNTTNKTLKWKSSNTKVATVDSKGKVKAVGSGTAKVTATTTNGKVATAAITVPYQKSLSAGTWKAGTHLPAGRYRITTTSGSGNLVIADNAYDRFVNEILSSKNDGFGVTVVTTDIKAGDSIKISGLNSVQFAQVKNTYSNTLHSGYWTVGKDIAPGTYRVTTPSGSGNLIAWSGSRLLINEILSSKPSSYEVSSVTSTFKTGDRIQISGLNKVVFTKR